MQQGMVTGKGVLPPEGCIHPRDFFDLHLPLTGITDKAAGKGGETSFIFEEVDEDGTVRPFELF
jgi:saccharopine dehydrogenase (NAD+, L-lysine-forming)